MLYEREASPRYYTEEYELLDEDFKVSVATEPTVIFSKNAKDFQDILTIDTGMVRNELREAGMTKQRADSFAIVVHDRQDLMGTPFAKLPGWYRSDGGYAYAADGETIGHPTAVNVVASIDSKRMSQFVWHEFGHALDDDLGTIYIGEQPYDKLLNKALTRGIGSVAAVGGATGMMEGVANILSEHPNYAIASIGMLAGTCIGSVGALAAKDPRGLLYPFSRNERYANKFARRRRKLQPVKLL